MEELNDIIHLNQVEEIKQLYKLNKNLNDEQSGILLSADVINNEYQIERYLLEIRKKWLAGNFDKSYDIFRSPIKYSYEDQKKFNNFEYERIMFSSPLEHLNADEFEKYISNTYIYSSGMSAINNTIFTIKSLFSKEIKLTSRIGYFETKNIVELYTRMGIKKNKNSNLEYTHIYMYEPIQYNFSQEPHKYIYELVELSNKETYTFIVIDISLFGDTYDVKKVLNIFKNNNKIVIIFVESLLKLSQRGMELTNAGRSRWYFHRNSSINEVLNKRIKLIRDLTGSNISNSNALLLNSNMLLNNYTYSFNIQRNNNEFYKSIESISNSIIKNIYYSSDNQISLIHMPFIFIEFHDTSERFSEIFLNYLNSYFQKYNVSLDIRDSFGFLNISCQYFIDRIHDKATFKIACGHLKGFKYFLLQKAIIKTNAYNSIEEFKKFVSEGL